MTSAGSGSPVIGLVMPLASQQGGAERLFQNLLKLRRSSLDYKVLFLENGPLEGEARALGYDTTVLPATHLRDLRNYLSVSQGISGWIKGSGIDLVFSWMLKAHLYAGPAALLAGRKRRWFQHGISKRHWMDRAAAALPADGILCCSKYTKDTQDQERPRRRTFVCHPGVQLESGVSITREEARLRLGLPLSLPIVCAVARLERWKGIHVLIDAARQLAGKLADAIFCVLGGAHPLDPQYATELQELARASGLGDRFKLLGQRPADEVRLWQAAADLVVHPVIDAEPFGMAVIEAMGTARVVVASNAGGISEIIEDGRSGVFVPPGDAVALAAAIDRLLADVTLRTRIEAAAAVRAREFSAEAFAARFEQQILSALAA